MGVARAVDYERQRDLARRRNQSAIATCVPRLLAGELLTIFGEGISTDARRLHMIRKGAMRFGYSAEQAADFQLGLVWIPVGISYSAKQRQLFDGCDGVPRCGCRDSRCRARTDPAVLRLSRQLGSLLPAEGSAVS